MINEDLNYILYKKSLTVFKLPVDAHNSRYELFVKSLALKEYRYYQENYQQAGLFPRLVYEGFLEMIVNKDPYLVLNPNNWNNYVLTVKGWLMYG